MNSLEGQYRFSSGVNVFMLLVPLVFVSWVVDLETSSFKGVLKITSTAVGACLSSEKWVALSTGTIIVDDSFGADPSVAVLSFELWSGLLGFSIARSYYNHDSGEGTVELKLFRNVFHHPNGREGKRNNRIFLEIRPRCFLADFFSRVFFRAHFPPSGHAWQMESAPVTSAPPGLSRPKEWEEVLNKISQPQSPPHSSAAPVPRSPHGKNRAKVKATGAPTPAPLGVDLLWALDMLEPIALPNPQIQKEEAGIVLHGLCIVRQVTLVDSADIIISFFVQQSDILSITRLCQYFVKFCSHQPVSFQRLTPISWSLTDPCRLRLAQVIWMQLLIIL